jgi:hypothetical protein
VARKQKKKTPELLRGQAAFRKRREISLKEIADEVAAPFQ